MNNEEVLIPQMTRIDKYKRHKIKIPFSNLVFICAAILLYICSTFININIKHYILPAEIFSSANLAPEDFIYSFCLIPQIPVIMFVASVLGRGMTTTSLFIYILLGLCGFPFFALGGGFHYIGQFGFGYILGYLPAVAITCKFLQEKYSFPNMIKAAICGVLTIHLIGIFYMIIVALFRHAGGAFIGGWIASQSGLKIIYDTIGSFVFILIGKYLNEGLRYISR